MAIGVGNIILHLPSGNKFTLCGVLYVPETAIHLISVGKLTDTGLTSTFTKDHCQVCDSMNNIILVGLKITNITPPIEWESLAKAPVTLKTWHYCLGYISYASIIELVMKHMVTGMPTNLSSIPPIGLGPNSISNFARKLGFVVYLMGSSVSVDTIFVNICYLINGLQKK